MEKLDLWITSGNEIFKPVYTLGYVANASVESSENEGDKRNSSTNTTSQNTLSNTSANQNTVELDEHDNVLTIPETTGIKGIVVKNYNNLYGIYDAKTRRLIPCSFTKIYSKTKSGVTTYYLEYNEQEFELESYLQEIGFFDENEEEQEQNQEQENNMDVNNTNSDLEENNNGDYENANQDNTDMENDFVENENQQELEEETEE